MQIGFGGLGRMACAEGFELIHESRTSSTSERSQPAGTTAALSWLLELSARALSDDPDLSMLRGYV
jgi:6-phosphogluconate dehydrogenase (decarboxylating)